MAVLPFVRSTDEYAALGLDTVRDVQPGDSVRDLMEKAMRGDPVDSSRLVRELARMLELARRTGEDFDRLVLLVRAEGLAVLRSLAMRGRVIDVVALPDGSALVHTTFSMSARDFAASQLGPLLLDEQIGGVACFGASQIEVAAAASSFEDALYLLGESVEILPGAA